MNIKNIKNIMQQEPNESIDIKISRILNECGIPAHLLGYEYIVLAIKEVMEDGTILHKVTLELYPRIAEKVNSTVSRVERAIRHAIKTAWVNQEITNSYILEDVFRRGARGYLNSPSNSEFIAEIARNIKLYKV